MHTKSLKFEKHSTGKNARMGVGVSAAATKQVLEHDLRDSSLALKSINELLDEQSRRMASEVHDEAGQLLATVFLRLDQASRQLSAACGSCFEEIKTMLALIDVQLREIAFDLRPTVLDDLGLAPAIGGVIDLVSKRYGLAIAFKSTLSGRLPAPIEMAIYRIIQESLNNIVKHARATAVDIWLTVDQNDIKCVIQDDGVGFDLNEVLSRKGARGLGLVGLRERAQSVCGVLTIHSLPGDGTTLTIDIPQEGNKCSRLG
jgi:signal transduction histidine kinase